MRFKDLLSDASIIRLNPIFVCLKILFLTWLVAFPLSGSNQKQGSVSGIKGIVTTDGYPLPGAQVWIDSLEIGDVTDENGRFSFDVIQPGEYDLTVSFIGYETMLFRSVQVSDSNMVELNVELSSTVIEMSGIMVTPKETEFNPEGVTARLSTRMIQEAPGAAQDIFLVLQTLPGVASGGDDSRLYVRGGNTDENLVIYDGMVIQNPFHFDIIGGGFYTVFNSSMVENVDFYSGGYPARYGDRLSAVMVINNREGNRKKMGGEFSLSMADVKGLIEFPVSESASTIFSLRRSYFDFLLGNTGFGSKYDLLPYFYDINSKTDIIVNDRNRLSINLLYSGEKLSGEFDQPHWVGTHSWASKSWTVGFRYRSILNNNVSSDLNVYRTTTNSIASHADGAGLEDKQAYEIAIKEELAIINENNEIHFGAWLVLDRSNVNIQLPVDLAYNFEALNFQSSGSLPKLALYWENTWKVNTWLALNYGLRGDYISVSSETILSPRLNVVLTPNNLYQVTANYGIYTQSPPAYELKNNPAQRSRRSQAWGLGLNLHLPYEMNGSIEIYRKNLSSLMSLDSQGNFDHKGIGNVWGFEYYLQKKSGQHFVGWVSYTYSVAKRREGAARELTVYNNDQTHIFSAVAQFRPSEKWKLSFRFRYATGRPYTPAEGSIYSSEMSKYLPIVGDRNSERYDSYHRLDIRVSRIFPEVLDGLIIYLETINTYDRVNPAYLIWNEDFSGKQIFSVFPFLPILGISLNL